MSYYAFPVVRRGAAGLRYPVWQNGPPSWATAVTQGTVSARLTVTYRAAVTHSTQNRAHHRVGR